jgi:hypothetical protein
MGKLLLILVLSASTLGLYHAVSVSGDVHGRAVQSTERHQLALARTAAQTGWARAKQALMLNFVTTTIQGENEGTPYTTTATVTGDRALVVSTGRLPRPRGMGETTYRITYALRKNPALTPRPRFMDYALVVDGNMSFSGSSTIVEPGVTDGSRDTLSIVVHANGTLSRGGSSVVQGFGTYTTAAAPGISGGFQPLYNPKGLPTVYASPRVSIPAINPDALVAEDGVDYEYPPGVSFSGRTLPGGTRLDPKIYRFRGNVSLTDVTVAGYAVFVADGHIILSKTVRGQTTGYSGPQESALALYTPGTISIGGSSVVYAQIVAGSGVWFTGSVSVYGSMVVGGNYSQGGSSVLHYRPASPGLTQGFTGRPDPGFTLLAVREQ